MKQVSYDYCFMRDQPGMESAKILVSKDRATRMVSAHVVPLKGAVIDWVIQQCARDLERLGQEAAIVDVLREIANLRVARGTLLEHSPVTASQSNGLIERGIRSVEEMTRVLLFDLSSRVGRPISVHSLVFPWIVEHATDILNKCHVARDGKSAYERLEETCTSWGVPAVWNSCDVQSSWQGSRRSHVGEVALGNVVGKTVPH